MQWTETTFSLIEEIEKKNKEYIEALERSSETSKIEQVGQLDGTANQLLNNTKYCHLKSSI